VDVRTTQLLIRQSLQSLTIGKCRDEGEQSIKQHADFAVHYGEVAAFGLWFTP
jgi:hypothetical protein